MAINEQTTNPNKATSIEEMQQIARNQIRARINELLERTTKLEELLTQVDSIVNWASYEWAIADVDEYGDAEDLTAAHILGEYYGDMKAGNYF